MELAEKPPLLLPPVEPDRGDNNRARFVMITDADIRKEARDPREINPNISDEDLSDLIDGNAAETLQKIWKRQNLQMLGCQISPIACDCGKNCSGSIWGIVIPKSERELFALIQHAVLAGALSLEQTDDMSIREGVFSVEYRDGEVDNGKPA